MKKYLFFLLGFILLLKGVTPAFSQTEEQKKIRILAIGNSYSSDALMYVPFILKNMGVSADIQIGILMQSSSSLKNHVDNFNDEAANYKFHLHNGGKSWSSSSKKTIQYALGNYEWDYVILQQSSSGAFKWSTYQPYLNQLINDVETFVNYPIKFGWYSTQSKPATANSGANYDDATITSHYESIAENSERVINETACEFIVPVSTAIQNARTIADIKALGGYSENAKNTSGLGYLTPKDGIHLQEGLPCQIAAYTFVLSILDLYGFNDYSIIGESTRVTSEWEAGKNILEQHGTPIGSTDDNCLIAQECAIKAIMNPYEVTDMNYIINDAPVTVTAKDYTIEYGDDIPTIEFTSEGAEVKGMPFITCEATNTSPVGSYPIVISRGTMTNYNTTFVNGTLTITKAPLKITAKDYTIKQGEEIPVFEPTYEGFKNNETSNVLTKQPTITTLATPASNPGEYEITVSGAEAQNYEITYVAGKLTVAEPPIKYDVNGDIYVNVADIVEVVDYINGNPSIIFNEEAADVNNDGNIDTEDILMMVDSVMKSDISNEDYVKIKLRRIIDEIFANGFDNIELSNDNLFLEKLKSLDTPNPIIFNYNNNENNLLPCISIIDDDTGDNQIPVSLGYSSPTVKSGGYFSVLLPLTLSLGSKYNKMIPVGLACEGHRVGLTTFKKANDNYSTLNVNGTAVKWLHDNMGWNVFNHSMTAQLPSKSYYVDGISSELANTILSEGTYDTSLSFHNTIVLDRLTGKWYEVNSTKTAWVERTPTKKYAMPFYRDYVTKKWYFNRDFDFEYSWGEWFKRADELGLPYEKVIVHNGNTSSVYTAYAGRKYAYFSVRTSGVYNNPPIAAIVNRSSDTPASSYGKGYNVWHDEWVSDREKIIENCINNKSWVVFMSHFNDQEYHRNYYLSGRDYPETEEGQPALRGKDPNYPSEWIVPLKYDEILDIIGDNVHDYINHPPSRLGISSWNEWHPAPGTQLAAFYYILDKALSKGVDIVAPMEGWKTHGNILNIGIDRNGQSYTYDSAKNQTPYTDEEKSYLTIGADMKVRFFNSKKNVEK